MHKNQPQTTTHRYHRIMSERTPTQQQDQSTPYNKINFNRKSLQRGLGNQKQVQYKSQRYSCKYRQQQKVGKSPFSKSKIYRSYSQAKNSNKKSLLNKVVQNNGQNEDFLIRIPKNQDLIENYIAQLKQLKRKVAEQRQSINNVKNNKKQLLKSDNNKQRLQINQNMLNNNNNFTNNNNNNNANNNNNENKNNIMSRNNNSLNVIKNKYFLNQNQINPSNNNSNNNKQFSLKLREKDQQHHNNNTLIEQQQHNHYQALGLIRKTQQVRPSSTKRDCIIGTNERKIFSRDMKKHIKKLQMFKQFANVNNDGQIGNDNEGNDCNNDNNFYRSPNNTNINNNNQYQHQQQHSSQYIHHHHNHHHNHPTNNLQSQSSSNPIFYPKKIIYGNVINLKQQIKLQSENGIQQKYAHVNNNNYNKKVNNNNNSNRYSTQGNNTGNNNGCRRLYSVSKSIDIKTHLNNNKSRNYTQQKIDKMPKSKSLMLRKNIEQSLVTTNTTRFNNNNNDMKQDNTNKRPLRPIQIQHINSTIITTQRQKLPQKPQTQRSPTKQKSPTITKHTNSASYAAANSDRSPQKHKQQQQYNQQQQIHPFKSIEGFSTIEDKKETLDILGESCLQIKHNLIESHKKMEHILDLLQENMIGLDSGHKEKKRKLSYERFSKAFPKGFFK